MKEVICSTLTIVIYRIGHRGFGMYGNGLGNTVFTSHLGSRDQLDQKNTRLIVLIGRLGGRGRRAVSKMPLIGQGRVWTRSGIRKEKLIGIDTLVSVVETEGNHRGLYLIKN